MTPERCLHITVISLDRLKARLPDVNEERNDEKA
jgi:hypothetical protein